MQWFTGARICEVGGIGGRIDGDFDRSNYGMIHVRLDNGCIGFYEAGWSRSLAAENRKEFIGDKGRLTLCLLYTSCPGASMWRMKMWR